jgi:hypothetical protein
MLFPEFEKMLDVVLPSAHPTSLTLTEVPLQYGQLTDLLEKAIRTGDESRTRLTGIHVPLRLFPDMTTSFRQVPVVDSGSADVVRLFFAP